MGSLKGDWSLVTPKIVAKQLFILIMKKKVDINDNPKNQKGAWGLLCKRLDLQQTARNRLWLYTVWKENRRNVKVRGS